VLWGTWGTSASARSCLFLPPAERVQTAEGAPLRGRSAAESLDALEDGDTVIAVPMPATPSPPHVGSSANVAIAAQTQQTLKLAKPSATPLLCLGGYEALQSGTS